MTAGTTAMTAFDALRKEPVDALFIEQQRQGAKVTFASVKKVADSLGLVDIFISPSGGKGAA